MLRYCLCVIAGASVVATFESLPAIGTALLVSVAGAAAAGWRQTRWITAVVAGGLLLWGASRTTLADRLAHTQVGVESSFTAEIIDFTKVDEDRLRLLVTPVTPGDGPERIRLSWYETDAQPRLGERWHLNVRLRRPRGFANPGGGDYAGWLFRQRIGATGYVLDGHRVVAGPGPGRTSTFRRRFVDRVTALLPADAASAVLLGITVGARHRIAPSDWERYAATGTSHLVAISGLHIGLAAGAGFAVARLLLMLVCPRGSTRVAALPLAVAVAALYALVSGFAIPAQRALLMAALAAAAVLQRRRATPARVLAAAGLAVIAADPLAVLAPGFGLSFAAVAILLWNGAQRPLSRIRNTDRLFGKLARSGRTLCHLQCALLFGLFPLLAVSFARVSVVAPLANLLVLPVFSVVTVPAALFGLACGGPLAAIGDVALRVSWYSLRGIIAVLDGLSGLPIATLPLAAATPAAGVLFLLPALYVLLPPGMPGRRLAWPALLAAVLYRPPAPADGCLDLQVLDVGQGLAAVVRTARHTVVFDTGPAFRGPADAARLVVLPYLQSVGIRRIDLVVVSHGDQDHAGGLASLLAAANVRQILSGEAVTARGVPAFPCVAGTQWEWDGVRFAMLYPRADDSRSGNNASCVLEVSAGLHRVLLTGDIEKRAERRLVERGRLRAASIVLVPHHGSRTSSSDAFVEAVRAQHAVVPVGHGNRWGFPKQQVVDRWAAQGASVTTTATAGAIRFRVCGTRGVRAVERHRERSRRYWHDAPR